MYSEPLVTISLSEYSELTKQKEINNELENVKNTVLVAAIITLYNNRNLDFINKQLKELNYIVEISSNQHLKFNNEKDRVKIYKHTEGKLIIKN